MVDRAPLRTAALDDAMCGEAFQPHRQNVFCNSEALLEVAEAADAEESVANNQQGPPVSHDLKGSGQRTVQFRKICLARHGCRVKPFVVWFHSATKYRSPQQEAGMGYASSATIGPGHAKASTAEAVQFWRQAAPRSRLVRSASPATSVLYALSPAVAALPAQPFDLALAMAGAVAGARTMFAAGTVGIFSDLVMAVRRAFLSRLNWPGAAGVSAVAGWIAILLSIVVFTFVDAIVWLCTRPGCRDERWCRRICRVQAPVRRAVSVGDHCIRSRCHAGVDQ